MVEFGAIMLCPSSTTCSKFCGLIYMYFVLQNKCTALHFACAQGRKQLALQIAEKLSGTAGYAGFNTKTKVQYSTMYLPRRDDKSSLVLHVLLYEGIVSF